MKRLLILSLLFSNLLSSAQSSDIGSQPESGRTPNDSLSYRELGIPYMQHYEAKDYDARPDNHTLLQGDNGLMYFGNGKGMLEFDGIDWRLIQLPNQGLAMTMTKNADGKMFVGGFNELGYLEADSLGFTAFRSIKTKLDSIYDDFGYLGFSFAVNNNIYFQARKHLFRWSNETFKAWSSENMYLYSTLVDGAIYVQEHKKGLLKLVNDEFKLITQVNYNIAEILSFNKNKLLVATRNNGLFFLEDNRLVPFPTPVDTYLKENTITRCRIIPNGWITIGTYKGGLVILDRKGSLVHILDKTKGLPDNLVVSHELDNQGALWLAFCKDDDGGTSSSISATASSFSVDGINNCSTSTGTGTRLFFDTPYTSSENLTVEKLLIKTTVSDGDSKEAINETFTDTSNSIEWVTCFTYGSQDWVEYEVRLEASDGSVSNVSKVRVNKPSGAE